MTYLVLDIIEELGISDFPTTLRINRNTPEVLLRRAAEVMRYGNGILAVYNEELVLDALLKFGYPLKEARNFANDGCWEVQIPGKTHFGYIPFDALAVLQHNTLRDYEAEFESFEELYEQYRKDIAAQVQAIYDRRVRRFLKKTEAGWQWREQRPCTAVSILEEGCFERGRSYLEGGAFYQIASPHIGGAADGVNGLYAIKKLVFEEKLLSFRELMAALKADWQGYEALRLRARSHYEYYGNDNDEVDGLMNRLMADFAESCNRLEKCPIQFPPGASTFGRQIEWIPQRKAAPHGRRQGDILAGNLSPTPGTAVKGATAMIRSHCKADLSLQTTGVALDLRLFPSDVKGETGLTALMGLIRGFVTLGGFFLQIDVADTAILRAAQEHPEDYPALAVRISGWNARFVTLSREWQDMVIANLER